MWQVIIYKKDRDPDELHLAVCTNYNKRGLGLPSGRFAELEKIFWSQHETSLGLGAVPLWNTEKTLQTDYKQGNSNTVIKQ